MTAHKTIAISFFLIKLSKRVQGETINAPFADIRKQTVI